LFIKNSKGEIIAPMNDVDASKLVGCTILAFPSKLQLRRVKAVSLDLKKSNAVYFYYIEINGLQND